MIIFKNAFYITLSVLVFVSLWTIWPSISFAQNLETGATITPSHVYQKTEVLRLKLNDLNLIDMQMYEAEPADVALRHPRHVMQKVRECHQIISKVLIAKNIQPDPVPGLFTVREIRPLDVKNGVEHLLAEVDKLGASNITGVPFEEGKLPDDVYNNLKRICYAIAVDIIPSDVYRVAVAVRENMDKIARSRGYEINLTQEQFDSKIPRDVYEETWKFLDDLRILALNPDYAIPGGIIIPNKQIDSETYPGDVIALMNDALAGTHAIKYTLGIGEQSNLPKNQPDKTPSDVFGVIYNAHLMVKKIIELEAMLDHKADK